MMPMDERCPHLGVLSADNRREPPVEFPSLENQCLASGAGDLILLGDQATYCLGREHLVDGAPPLVDGLDGLAATRLVLAMEESAQRGAPVEVGDLWAI